MRKLFFQLHWFLGIGAGLVISIVSVTGAMLSFQPSILLWLNPGVMTVETEATAMTPEALLSAIKRQKPDTQLARLTFYSDPKRSAEMHYQPEKGQRRGVSEYVNPYDGQLLGKAQGKSFFTDVMRLHRWLLVGEAGKQVVAAATLILIFLALSGLYLRWPKKRWKNWRIWLAVDFRKRGKVLWWELHSKLGTWVLPFYLLACLTGLFWSYEWYREGLFQLSGVERSQQHRPISSGNKQSSEMPLDEVWQLFTATIPDFQQAMLPLQSGETATIRYLSADASHSRAYDSLTLHRDDGKVVKQSRFQDQSLPEKLMGSMLPLHSGEYFGLAGLILMMLASLLMPVFFITGCVLYIGRRQRRRRMA